MPNCDPCYQDGPTNLVVGSSQRVGDADHLAGNTNVPVIAVAERGTDLIRTAS